jgi:hypothetical protein
MNIIFDDRDSPLNIQLRDKNGQADTVGTLNAFSDTMKIYTPMGFILISGLREQNLMISLCSYANGTPMEHKIFSIGFNGLEEAPSTRLVPDKKQKKRTKK